MPKDKTSVLSAELYSLTTNYANCLELLAPSYEVLHWLYSDHSSELWSTRIVSKLLLYIKGILAFGLVNAHSPGSFFPQTFIGLYCSAVVREELVASQFNRHLFSSWLVSRGNSSWSLHMLACMNLRGVTGHIDSFRIKICSSYMGSFMCFSSKFIF